MQKNDFIEIEYDAFDYDSGKLVDTTNEKKAKEEKIYQEGVKYGGIVICLGFRDVIQGLDDFIIGKERIYLVIFFLLYFYTDKLIKEKLRK